MYINEKGERVYTWEEFHQPWKVVFEDDLKKRKENILNSGKEIIKVKKVSKESQKIFSF